MNYDHYGAWGCIEDLCDMIFETEHDLLVHENTDHLPRRKLRNKRDPGPTDTEVKEAVASIAKTIKEQQHED